jgi:signal transduction histidine kinase
MIKSFRLKLTTYFVVLSLIVYVLIAVCAVLFFRGVLTKVLDDRLYMLASEVGHAIDIVQNEADSRNSAVVPRLRDWKRRVTTDPVRGLASAQLFDREGKLLESFGPHSVKRFFKRAGEVMEDGVEYRVLYTPLKLKSEIVGFVQVDTLTQSRDSSVESLVITLCLLGPFVVIGLGAISYYVSGIAAEPLLVNMAAMRRFIEDAGHELNTPLSIVRAKSEALERRLDAAGVSVPEAEATLRSVARMEKIVSDLMYLTELDTALIANQFELIDVSTLLLHLGEDFEARFSVKNVGFAVASGEHLRGEHIRVRGEPDALYRALSNLTENALRYTDSGHVKIGAQAAHGQVVITIEDTGIGIPAESLERLFERFYRVDKSRSRASGGVGLGLSIVKTIVEAHRGSLSVVSEVNKGTTFTVTLPVV